MQLLDQAKAIVRYDPQPEQLGAEGAEKIQENLNNQTVSYLKEEDVVVLQNMLPDLTIQRRKDNNKAYVKTEELVALLKATDIPTVDVEALDQLEKGELEQELTTYQEQQKTLQQLLYTYDYWAYPYEQLTNNEGNEAITQTENYTTTVAQHQAVKALFGQKLLTVQAQQQQLEGALAKQSIPLKVQEAATQLEGHKQAVNKQLKLMQADMEAMQVLPLSLIDWKKHLQELETALVASKEAYKVAKEAYNTILQQTN